MHDLVAVGKAAGDNDSDESIARRDYADSAGIGNIVNVAILSVTL
jgi:hypothetical protein